ncbi:MAG TPA: DUF4190 domain-containing protein [Pyrinomonadaceae bacterium]
MSSRKCPQCGLVNWASADSCKRCDLNFAGEGQAQAEAGFSNESASAPPYQPAPPYGYNSYARPTQKRAGLAIASLVVGILSFMTFGMFGVGAVAAFIMGIVALRRARKNPALYGGEGFAIAGVVLGSVSALIFAYVLVIAAISIPNLLASRRAANEAGTMMSLRQIASAEATYYATKGMGRRFGTLQELAEEGLIDQTFAKGIRFGYRFELRASGTSFEAAATPLTYGQTSSPGKRSFYLSSDSGYVIRAADKKGLEADASDPPAGQPNDTYTRAQKSITDPNY